MKQKKFEEYCSEAVRKTMDEVNESDTDKNSASGVMLMSVLLFCSMMEKHLTNIMKSNGELESDEPVEESTEEPTFEGVM